MERETQIQQHTETKAETEAGHARTARMARTHAGHADTPGTQTRRHAGHVHEREKWGGEEREEHRQRQKHGRRGHLVI